MYILFLVLSMHGSLNQWRSLLILRPGKNMKSACAPLLQGS